MMAGRGIKNGVDPAHRDHPAACGTLPVSLAHIESGSYREEIRDGHAFKHVAPQHEFLFDGDLSLPTDVLRRDDALFFHKLCLLLEADLLRWRKPTLRPRACMSRRRRCGGF
jgi:hypothetical protein